MLLSRKKEFDGIVERERILAEYLPPESFDYIRDQAKEYRCSPDDLLDAAVLAVTGLLYNRGEYETIPEQPDTDDHGLLMKLTVPKKMQ